MAVVFYQVMISMRQSFDLEPLPNDLSKLFGVFEVVEFDLLEVAYPYGCIGGGYKFRLLSTALFPFGVLFVLSIFTITGGVLLSALRGAKAPNLMSSTGRNWASAYQETKERSKASMDNKRLPAPCHLGHLHVHAERESVYLLHMGLCAV